MKPISFVSSPVPNYLTFILCTVGINWKNEYTEQYHDFLTKFDRDYLLEHTSKLSFGDGDGDPLIELFFFLPAHVGFDKDVRIIEYFQVLSKCALLNNFSQLFARFQTDIHEIRQFIPNFMESYNNQIEPGVNHIIHTIASIYQRYYDRFLNEIWNPDFEAIEQFQDWIEIMFRGTDIIVDWERTTGLHFHGDSYKICLIRYLRYGPRANSISYDKNLFPASQDEETQRYYRYFISHEVGTHLLKEHTYDLYMTDKKDNWVVPYIVLENMARYYNMKILPMSLNYNLGEDYYHDSIFNGILADLEKEYPGDIQKQYLTSITRFEELQQKKQMI
jgi:hypothetical protein